MISNIWKASRTIRIEITPQEFKLATKGTKDQVQTKSMGTILKHTKKITENETNNATETMAGRKETMVTAQTIGRTDNLTNTLNKEKPETNTTEGQKSKRQKRLPKARNATEPAYKSNHSPNTPKGVTLGKTPHPRLRR